METILLAAGCAFLAGYILSGVNSRKWGRYPAYAGIISFLSWIIVRAFDAGHAPFSGIYESMVFFAFLYFLKIALLSRFPEKTKAVTLLPALVMASIALFLPGGMKTAGPGSPALESFWIWLHVPGIFIGYVSLTIGFILAVISNAGSKTAENYLDAEMKIAFYFTALGIITGGFWAQLSWGSFWSWDPKETWALFTFAWLVLEMHTGRRRPVLRRIFIYAAFATMLFNYFGVTFLLSGLHSYR